MTQMTIEKAFQLGVQHHQAGRLQEAEQIYLQILEEDPNHADALHLLGVILHQIGRNDAAVEFIREAIAIKPNYPEAHCNLGNALKNDGQLDEAIAAFRQAIALRPNSPEIYNNLGNALKDKGQLEEAIVAYRQAIALGPNFPEAHNHLGNVLRDKGQLDEAIAACRQAIALRPNYPEAHCNLGNALKDQGQLDEAIAVYRQAIALRPNDHEAHSNFGAALAEKGQLDEAIAAYRQALAFNADFPEAHNNLALALLAQEDFSQGWEEYEWRWRCKDFPVHRRFDPARRWDGSALKGRTLLLYAEQGFGDAIQFIRYQRLAAELGGRTIIECQPELKRLFENLGAGQMLVTRDADLPAFDVHCPLLSLPRMFGTTAKNIPADVPYLRANVGDEKNWNERLAGDGSRLKVGLAWAGNPKHRNDRNRSLRWEVLAELARVPGVRYYSLQKDRADRVVAPPQVLELVDLMADVKDFADTAALIANLDLVISVDTAIVHLAGALAKPVWTLLPFVPDWRWLLHRTDSPWYPTMRLFRQPAPGDWNSVIQQVTHALTQFVPE